MFLQADLHGATKCREFRLRLLPSKTPQARAELLQLCELALRRQDHSALQHWVELLGLDDAPETIGPEAFYRGVHLFRTGKADQAIEALEVAMAAKPDSRNAPRVLYHLIRSYKMLGLETNAKGVLALLKRDYPQSQELKACEDEKFLQTTPSGL